MPPARTTPVHVAWRRLTAPIRALPDYLVIGAQKSGTTTLHAAIVAHPDVLAPVGKEVHYFDRTPLRSETFYRSFFPVRPRGLFLGAGRAGRITGESTPAYIADPDAPARVHALIPDVLLLAVLRDPAERALSHHAHEVRKGREQLPFSEAIRAEAAGQGGTYLQRGRYAHQLVPWIDRFGLHRLHVLMSSTLFGDPPGAMTGVWEFLGLRPFEVDVPYLNAHCHNALDPDDERFLRAFFHDDDLRLEAMLDQALPWRPPSASP